MTADSFQIELDVRDHECDLQGIVNNAVYQHYLEHARHLFIKRQLGVDFAQVTESGVHLVVIRAELDYKAPLRSGDTFLVTAEMEQVSPVRFCFNQTILRKSDQQLMIKAKIFCAAINTEGRPMLLKHVQGLGF